VGVDGNRRVVTVARAATADEQTVYAECIERIRCQLNHAAANINRLHHFDDIGDDVELRASPFLTLRSNHTVQLQRSIGVDNNATSIDSAIDTVIGEVGVAGAFVVLAARAGDV